MGLTPETVAYGPHGEDGMIVRTTDFECCARPHHGLHRTIYAMDEQHQVGRNLFFSSRIKAPAIPVIEYRIYVTVPATAPRFITSLGILT